MSTPNHALSTINVDDPFAMRYWARQLRVSEAELRSAIVAAGNSIGSVRQHFDKLSPQPRRAGRPRT